MQFGPGESCRHGSSRWRRAESRICIFFQLLPLWHLLVTADLKTLHADSLEKYQIKSYLQSRALLQAGCDGHCLGLRLVEILQQLIILKQASLRKTATSQLSARMKTTSNHKVFAEFCRHSVRLPSVQGWHRPWRLQETEGGDCPGLPALDAAPPAVAEALSIESPIVDALPAV